MCRVIWYSHYFILSLDLFSSNLGGDQTKKINVRWYAWEKKAALETSHNWLLAKALLSALSIHQSMLFKQFAQL